MKVVACSSGCCAIKHIRDFMNSPIDRIQISSHAGHDEDQSSTQPEPYDSWEYADSQYVEAGTYFKELVAQIQGRRVAGMITANLVSAPLGEYCCEACHGPEEDFEADVWDESQVIAWRPVFNKLGFKEEIFRNSNSGSRIHHFTLTYDEE